MKKTEKKPEERWIMWGIPFVFAAGAALHYVYALSGRSVVAATLAPVNESIWEHTKMAYLPTALWWGGYYKKHKADLSKDKWFSAALAALVACIAAMPAGYYLYTGIIGRHFLAADISLLALAAAAGQMLGRHIYKYGKGRPKAFTSMALIAAIGAVFAFFTFHAPHLPLFKDGLTGCYGIDRN